MGPLCKRRQPPSYRSYMSYRSYRAAYQEMQERPCGVTN